VVQAVIPELERVSPSSISAFLLCKRKFYYQYRLKIPRKPSRGKDLGSAVHNICESWILYREIPDITGKALDCARALFPHLPVLHTDQVEQKIRLEIPGFPVITGRVDHWGYSHEYDNGSSSIIESQEVSLGHSYVRDNVPKILVSDIKTLSDFRYVKTHEQLRDDPQAVIYCTAFASHGNPTFRHLYVRTTPPHYTKVVEISYDREELKSRLVGILGTVYQMMETYSLPLKEVAGNTNMCDTYGGCDFRCHCAAEGIQSLGVYSPRKQ